MGLGHFPGAEEYIMRPILETPERLVTDGKFNFGTYKAPFKLVNPLDAKLAGGLLPRALKWTRLKEWQHFALVNQRFYISLAIFDAKTMALAQVCVYDRTEGRVMFYERKLPTWSVKVPRGIWDSRARYKGKGFKIDIHNHLYGQGHEIEFYSDAKGDLPPIAGSFICFEKVKVDEPMVVALPLGENTGMYTHKFVCPASGRLTIGDQEHVFGDDAYGLIDIHKGYYPYVMKWHWATCGGRDDQGRLLGLNLTNNQVKDQDAYNENCFWVDGKVRLLPPVTFTFDDPEKPWLIKDREGKVDLVFTPQVVRRVNVNALVIRSNYKAPFGEFSGRVIDDEGNVLEVKNLFGMAEDFYLRT